MEDFKRREVKLEEELRLREEEIERLKAQGPSFGRGTFTNMDRHHEEAKESKYVQFVEGRLEECLEENKRYHRKYVDMREFAYTSIESLIRQLNARKRNAIQNSNLNVYKQLFDKERKHWLEEKDKAAELTQAHQKRVHEAES